MEIRWPFCSSWGQKPALHPYSEEPRHNIKAGGYVVGDRYEVVRKRPGLSSLAPVPCQNAIQRERH